MKFGIALAAVCMGALFASSSATLANEVTTAQQTMPAVSSQLETGYVTTQGRRGGGGFRGRGGPVIVAGPRRRNNFGRNVAIGVGAAVVGGIIANEVYRSRPAYGGNSCGRWDYQCSRGAGWACRNLDRYC